MKSINVRLVWLIWHVKIILKVYSKLKLTDRIHISTFTPSFQLVFSIATDNVKAFPLTWTHFWISITHTHSQEIDNWKAEEKRRWMVFRKDQKVHFLSSTTVERKRRPFLFHPLRTYLHHHLQIVIGGAIDEKQYLDHFFSPEQWHNLPLYLFLFLPSSSLAIYLITCKEKYIYGTTFLSL